MTDVSIFYDSPNASAILGNGLYNAIKTDPFIPVVMCIGSDRITGDCLGPLCGHLLTSKYGAGTFVYGTLNNPVTAKNLVETARFIRTHHDKQRLIVVDASLGNDCDIGLLRLGLGGVYPGSAVNKRLPKVGDYHLTAVVNMMSANHTLLQSTRLAHVFKMAEVIAAAVSGSIALVSSQNTAAIG